MDELKQLDDELVCQGRRYAHDTALPFRTIAEILHVGPHALTAAIRGRTFAHITDPPPLPVGVPRRAADLPDDVVVGARETFREGKRTAAGLAMDNMVPLEAMIKALAGQTHAHLNDIAAPIPRAEARPVAKRLTDAQVAEGRLAMHADQSLTFKAIADRYGVDMRVAYVAMIGETHARVDDLVAPVRPGTRRQRAEGDGRGLPDNVVIAMRRKRAAGGEIADIADEFKLPYPTAYNAIAANTYSRVDHIIPPVKKKGVNPLLPLTYEQAVSECLQLAARTGKKTMVIYVGGEYKADYCRPPALLEEVKYTVSEGMAHRAHLHYNRLMAMAAAAKSDYDYAVFQNESGEMRYCRADERRPGDRMLYLHGGNRYNGLPPLL